MNRRKMNIFGQSCIYMLLHGIAEQNNRPRRSLERSDNLRQRQDHKGTILFQFQCITIRTPCELLYIGAPLLCVHHTNEAHTLTDAVMGKRLECRNSNQGNAQSI